LARSPVVPGAAPVGALSALRNRSAPDVGTTASAERARLAGTTPRGRVCARPARGHRRSELTCSESVKTSFDRGAPVHQFFRRPNLRLFRRRHNREPDHRALSPQRLLRHRAEHRLYLQRQKRRRQRDRQGAGVRYVLEGSVQRDQNQVRVNAQLIDATTGGHLWAERFDKPLSNLFSMQDEIVASLASQLGSS
jgi:hypothetical protein